MAAVVNIRRDVKDKFYRYKSVPRPLLPPPQVEPSLTLSSTASSLARRMPLLLTKIEGKGNGIKTVFPNMADVARALNRPASCASPSPRALPGSGRADS